jgi:DNA polymerase-3 subunit alpha
MSDFVHLHVHSDYSLLESTVRIKALVAKAKAMGMSAVGISDSGNLFGSLHFFKACKAEGINPIIGCQFQVVRGSMENMDREDPENVTDPLLLFATSEQGYLNLSLLTSDSYSRGYLDQPRIDEAFIAASCQDLIGLSGNHEARIPSLLRLGRYDEAKAKALQYRDMLGDGNFYLEIQDHGLEEEIELAPLLEQLSADTGIPLVATNDVHYLETEDSDAQDTLTCIKSGRKKNDFSEVNMGEGEYYFKSAEEMELLFGHLPEAIVNSGKIADRCNVNIPEPGPLLPDFDIPEEFEGPNEYLRHLVFQGLEDRYEEINDEIRQRADYELDTIIQMGFTGYFLIVWDFIDYAKKNDIPVGPGRGSGAGSIVAYALTITDLDPLKYELLFERFLNPERVSMPDFDIDFCFERRGEVIDYVTRKYGTERVAQIITFGTLKAKAVLKDVSRALDIRFTESNMISSLVPGDPKITIPKAMEEEPKLQEIYERGGIYKELIDTATKLEGLHRHTSTHAAGVVIGKDVLTKYSPLYRDPKTGAISTQFTMDIIEPCGLVKMDFLGLKTLTLIKHTIDLIHAGGKSFSIDEIKDEDPKTFKLLGEGKSTCIFQFESSGMQKILKQAKPGNIEDLIALNALYRPGPMQYIPQFIDSKLGKMAIQYPDPTLEETLKPTYGVIVYQEQVMKVAQIIGGFSLGKADILRRAMGKKKVKDMEKMKVEFIAGAKEKGHSEEHAADIFHMLEPFAGYGFNKSHAAAYSVVAYQTAYLKAHFTAEFMAANLTNELNSQEKLGQYIGETKALGLQILPPHVNLSQKVFSVRDEDIIFGLMGVKNLGDGPCEEIIRAREAGGEFQDFVDFLQRVDLRIISRKVIETGIQAGLFDGLAFSRAAMWESWQDLVNKIQKEQESTAFGQGGLFDGDEIQADYTIPEIPEWDVRARISAEKNLTGFFFSRSPPGRYQGPLEANGEHQSGPGGQCRQRRNLPGHGSHQRYPGDRHQEGFQDGLAAAGRLQRQHRAGGLSQGF